MRPKYDGHSRLFSILLSIYDGQCGPLICGLPRVTSAALGDSGVIELPVTLTAKGRDGRDSRVKPGHTSLHSFKSLAGKKEQQYG